MGKTAGGLAVLGAVFATVLAGVSCSLNAQPEPPGAGLPASGTGGGATGGAGGGFMPGAGGSTSAGAAGGTGGSAALAGAGGAAGFDMADASVPTTYPSDASRELEGEAGGKGDAETDGGDGSADSEGGDG